LITEFSEHGADRGETQECQGIAGEVFKVLGRSPASVEPGEGAFDNPTLWENLVLNIGRMDDRMKQEP
jgi:hypothetical protein